MPITERWSSRCIDGACCGRFQPSIALLALALATPVVSVAQAKDGIGEIVAGLSARLEATRQRSLIELARVIEADPRVRDRADVHVAVADLLRAEKARILEWGRQRKADEEGEYDVLCTIHAGMRIKVTVKK